MKLFLTLVSAVLVLVSCEQASSTTLVERPQLNAFSDYQVTGLTTSVDGTTNQITLTWKPSSGADSYEIQQLMPAPLDWQTYYTNLSGTTKTFAAPQLRNQDMVTKPLRLYWSGRVKAVKGDYSSIFSDPISQELKFDYTLVAFDGSNTYKVTNPGPNQYQAEFHLRNDGNLTIHNFIFYFGYGENLGGGGGYAPDSVQYPGAIAPGETVTLVGAPRTISSFVPTYASPYNLPRFDLN